MNKINENKKELNGNKTKELDAFKDFSVVKLDDYRICAVYQEKEMKNLEGLNNVSFELKHALKEVYSAIEHLKSDFPNQSVKDAFLAHYPRIDTDKEQATAFDMLHDGKIGFLKIENIRCKMLFDERNGNVAKMLKLGISHDEPSGKTKMFEREN